MSNYTRTLFFVAIMLEVMVASGCSRSGDLNTFVVTEVTTYGGHTATNAAISKLNARWTVKRDANSFRATVIYPPFELVATNLEQTFGKPKVSDDGSGIVTHEPYRLWTAADTGVAIQLIGHPYGTEIICVRGFKDLGEMFKSMGKWRHFEDLGFSRVAVDVSPRQTNTPDVHPCSLETWPRASTAC